MQNFFKSIFALIIFLLSLTAVRAADFSVKIENPSVTVTSNGEVHIPIMVERTSDYNFLMPFTLEIDYNHNIFGFKKFKCNSPYSEKDFTSKENNSSLTILSNFKKIIPLTFKSETFPLGDIVLFVKDGAPSGQYPVFSKFHSPDKIIESDTQINVSSNENSTLSPETIKNQKNKSGCKLKSITPEIGTLSPSFDPNIFEYSIDVDENVQYLELNAEPQESDSIVKISRRKLEAAGSTTTIRITVSNGKDKTIYVVKVNRAAKTDSKNGSKNGKGSNKSEKSGKNGKRKKKNSVYGDDFDDDDDYDFDNDEENDNNSENEIVKSENNQKIYLIVVLGAVTLTVIGYYTYKFIKYKRKNSKNTKNSLNKPLK